MWQRFSKNFSFWIDQYQIWKTLNKLLSKQWTGNPMIWLDPRNRSWSRIDSAKDMKRNFCMKLGIVIAIRGTAARLHSIVDWSDYSVAKGGGVRSGGLFRLFLHVYAYMFVKCYVVLLMFAQGAHLYEEVPAQAARSVESMSLTMFHLGRIPDNDVWFNVFCWWFVWARNMLDTERSRYYITV